MSRSVLVFCGGDAPSDSTIALVRTCDLVVAADSGIDHALDAGFAIDVAVGDFDSVSVAGLAAVRASSATVQEHPTDKDQTDFELALAAAVAAGATHVEVLAITGGRLDHQLANLLALSNPVLSNVEVRAYTENEKITVIRERAILSADPGTVISLIPIGSEVSQVVTTGLTYSLNGQSLSPASSRGVSNTFEAAQATVEVGSGVLLAIENRS